MFPLSSILSIWREERSSFSFWFLQILSNSQPKYSIFFPVLVSLFLINLLLFWSPAFENETEERPGFSTMQLYHHPYSLDSQRVRLALEEKGIDYTSFHVNPVTVKNMDASFFRRNPSAKLPVFQNGHHVIYNTIEIIQYVERIALVSSGKENIPSSGGEVTAWMHRIKQWNPKFFTLSHIPKKHRDYVSKFIRQVIIARMAEATDLAPAYHTKLVQVYETEDKLKDPVVLKQSKEQLIRLLDQVETKLNESAYLAGEEFSMADVMLVPVLARLVLLNLKEEYIDSRPNTARYWIMVQQRPSYKKVIGKHFSGWRKHKTFIRTWCFVHIRTILRRF